MSFTKIHQSVSVNGNASQGQQRLNVVVRREAGQ
jgi:hypothetical protein